MTTATKIESPGGLGPEAQDICQALLRMDTTNPPGNELPAATYLQRKLQDVGLEASVLESAPGRGNLVCRYGSTGEAEPLLITAHLDVAEAQAGDWTHGPLSGEIADGCLWGRGAVDMKHMTAMCTAVMRRLARDRPVLGRDVIFAAVADEEAGCDHGSRFLVDEYPELVRAEYALGALGGFSLHMAGTAYYPIQVAEKGVCWIRATARGTAGHGAMPRDQSALVKLAEAAARLGSTRLPVHLTRQVRDFLQAIATQQPAYARPLLRVLSHPRLLPRILELLPDRGSAHVVHALMSNTAAPTVLRAGGQVNVVAGSAELLIDGRTLPGQTEDDLIREIRAIIGDELELEIVRSMPPVVTEPVASPLFDCIKEQLQQREPGCVVVPFLSPEYTDAKHFSRLGTRWYGFCPLKLDPRSNIRFADLFHGKDERVPVAGLHWGAEMLYRVVSTFCAPGAATGK